MRTWIPLNLALCLLFLNLCCVHLVSSYWLMGANNVLTTQRIDPIQYPGRVSSHVHSILGGSSFGLNLSTAMLRQSTCTSIPLLEDKSNYWYPHLYWQRGDGSFVSVEGSPVICELPVIAFTTLKVHLIDYLFSDQANATTAFPDEFRMISGDPALRTYDNSSFSQQAVTFICLNFEGTSSRHNELPVAINCSSGIRAQINFPSCWDGKNIDSLDHKSHISFPSGGPDSGTCSDPNYPITVPRIFLEVYWHTDAFSRKQEESSCPDQPFVFSNGDPTGYGFHADFFNGWDAGALQKAITECNCNPYGDPACCVAKGTFHMQQTTQCFLTNTFDEQVTGNLSALPGANPVQFIDYVQYTDSSVPAMFSPVVAYTSVVGSSALIPTGTIAKPAETGIASPSPSIMQKSSVCRLKKSGGNTLAIPRLLWSTTTFLLVYSLLLQ